MKFRSAFFRLTAWLFLLSFLLFAMVISTNWVFVSVSILLFLCVCVFSYVGRENFLSYILIDEWGVQLISPTQTIFSAPWDKMTIGTSRHIKNTPYLVFSLKERDTVEYYLRFGHRNKEKRKDDVGHTIYIAKTRKMYKEVCKHFGEENIIDFGNASF